MDPNAVFTITYGLYILASEYNGQKNACIVNTVAQVTQTPLVMSVTVMKTNLTHDLIKKSGKFSVSVLGQHADLTIVERFGTVSGRETDKFSGFECKEFESGDPLIEQGAIAVMDCKVISSVDLGTHTVFFADLVDAVNVARALPLTYTLYRDAKMGKARLNPVHAAPAKPGAVAEVWQCTVCHYIYDGDIPFNELPDDYTCPLCGVGKEFFEKL